MNNTDAIDAQHTALAVVDENPQANVALFGTSDPVEVIRQATRVADALKEIIVKKGLVSNIKGKQYPQVEAWQTLAVMLGLAAVCEWSREIPDGWEARVVVQRNGITIAAAEAQCTRSETTWKNRDAYALRSMAQTRAISKSLRSVLGFVMVLSGFQPTPAEEMPPTEDKPAKPVPPDDSARLMGVSAIQRYCAKHGLAVPATEGKSVDDLRSIYEGLVASRKAAQAASAPVAQPQSQPAPQPAPEAQETPHKHLACSIGPDPVKGHNHYCDMEEVDCGDVGCDGPGTNSGHLFPPASDGVAPSQAVMRRLFAILNDLGHKEKAERLGYASSFGLDLASYSELSQGQAMWLADRAQEELDGGRAAQAFECPACGTFEQANHRAGCPEA